MIFKTFLLLAVLTVIFAHELSVEEEWKKFKVHHNKAYSSPAEEKSRFQIFEENLNKIREHNKKYKAGEVSWEMGLNEFADLTSEEFAKSHTGLRIPNGKAAGVA